MTLTLSDSLAPSSGEPPKAAPTARLKVIKVHVQDSEPRVEIRDLEDDIACEAPLEISVGGKPFATTMRTPGADLELIYGLLLAEGKIVTSADVSQVRMLNRDHANVTLAPSATMDRGATGCDDAAQMSEPAAGSSDDQKWPATLLIQMTTKLKAHQPGFHKTGALHGAALFDRDGQLLVVREDIGRHNAVDKVIGWGLRSGMLPQNAANLGLAISSRASFELVCKAAAAHLPVMVVVSAPTSMGVQAARDADLTLCAFARPPTMTVYSGEGRIAF